MATSDVKLLPKAPAGNWIKAGNQTSFRANGQDYTLRQDGAGCSLVREQDKAQVRFGCASPAGAVVVSEGQIGIYRRDGLVFGVNPLFSDSSPLRDAIREAKTLLKQGKGAEAGALLLGVAEDKKVAVATRFKAVELLREINPEWGRRAIDSMANDTTVPVQSLVYEKRIGALEDAKRLLEANIGAAMSELDRLHKHNVEEIRKSVREALRRKELPPGYKPIER